MLRLLAALGSCGIRNVLMMPDRHGLCALLQRNLERERAYAKASERWPTLTLLDMPVTGTVQDSQRASRLLQRAGAAATIVLGGDGTHRAVVSECADVPIAGLSTGTNNAYPQTHEPTSVGLAVGLYASGRIPAAVALVTNKCLDIQIFRAGTQTLHEIALVDVAVLRDPFIGAGAMWDADALAALYLSFSEPDAVGLSSIGGLLQPVGRREAGGLYVELAPCDSKGGAPPKFMLMAPIAPGLLRPIGIRHWQRLENGVPAKIQRGSGAIALDGERSIGFAADDTIQATLHENAFLSVDVKACMRYVATQGILRNFSSDGAVSAPDMP